MARLADLTSQDLSYIFGEREGGPNGAKRDFLRIGKTFLRAMANRYAKLANIQLDRATDSFGYGNVEYAPPCRPL